MELRSPTGLRDTMYGHSNRGRWRDKLNCWRLWLCNRIGYIDMNDSRSSTPRSTSSAAHRAAHHHRDAARGPVRRRDWCLGRGLNRG